MPRQPRQASSSGIYHLVMRSRDDRKLFLKVTDFEFYLDLLARMKKTHRFSIYHYVLLAEEIHLLIHAESLATLTSMIQRLHLNYSSYYREEYAKQESLFEDRYRSFPIEKPSDLLECARIIEQLPVSKKQMKSVEYYGWSSYRYYAYGQKNPLITENPFYIDLEDNIKERMQLYRQYLTLRRPYDTLILRALTGK